MNFIKKQNYRHKIIEHLLNQYGEQEEVEILDKQNQIKQLNKHQNNKIDQQINDMSEIDNHNSVGDNYYHKISSKQKALIIDDEQYKIEKQNRRHLVDKNNNIINLSKEQKENNQIDNRIKRHQGKQNYFYHQKNQIFMVSNDLRQKKVRQGKKNRTGLNQKQNNQNNQQENKKQHRQNTDKNYKKYRFIIQNKVQQALESKRKMQNQRILQKEQIIINQQKKIQNNQICNEKLIQNDTHRSKGSKQMIDFLQSARQRLFINKNSYQLSEVDKQNQENIQQQQIVEQYQSAQSQQQRQQRQRQTNNNIKMNEHHISSKFQIQIQLSPTKTRKIELTSQSDPRQSAHIFIQQNKLQLREKGYLSDRLQQILVNQIESHIERHKKLIIQQKQKEIQEKYKQIIHQLGVNETLLRHDDQCDQMSKLNKNNCQNRYQYQQTQRKKHRQNNFSHVYIDNIDSNPYEQESEIRKQKGRGKKYEFNQQNMKLGGYYDSPHELITYRENSKQHNESQNGQIYEGQIEQFQKQGYQHFPISKCTAQFKSNHKNVELKKDEQNIGASKILSKSRQKRTFNQQQISKSLAELTQTKYINIENLNQSKQQTYNKMKEASKQHQLNNLNGFNNQSSSLSLSINAISQQIVNRIGKQNILNGLRIRQREKKQKIYKQRQLRQLKELEECSFKPKINKVSEFIQNNKKKMKLMTLLEMTGSSGRKEIQNTENNQNNLDKSGIFSKYKQNLKDNKRYDDLYNNYKVIEAKKQLIRRKSIQQIPFKPQINLISSKIIQTKRNSLTNSTCKYQSSNQSTTKSRQKCLGSSHYQCYLDESSNTIHKKRKSAQIERQGLDIGHYLYKQAMRLRKKKESVPRVLVENFKPLEKSEKILCKTKEKRLSDIFDELTKNKQNSNREKVLNCSDIDLRQQKYQQAPLKHIVPLLEQLKQLQISLNRQQFIQSGIKLLNYLSTDERNQILLKKNNIIKNIQQQNKQNVHMMNKVSKKILENKLGYEQNIYHRGLIYKKSIKDKLQTSKQNNVRVELQNCTFKPKINIS